MVQKLERGPIFVMLDLSVNIISVIRVKNTNGEHDHRFCNTKHQARPNAKNLAESATSHSFVHLFTSR